MKLTVDLGRLNEVEYALEILQERVGYLRKLQAENDAWLLGTRNGNSNPV